jgi:hypothetical protein
MPGYDENGFRNASSDGVRKLAMQRIIDQPKTSFAAARRKSIVE